MFETVVVGADGSDTAAEAVRVAAELVKLSSGNLHIVTAYRPQQLQSQAGSDFSESLTTSGDLAQWAACPTPWRTWRTWRPARS